MDGCKGTKNKEKYFVFFVTNYIFINTVSITISIIYSNDAIYKKEIIIIY